MVRRAEEDLRGLCSRRGSQRVRRVDRGGLGIGFSSVLVLCRDLFFVSSPSLSPLGFVAFHLVLLPLSCFISLSLMLAYLVLILARLSLYCSFPPFGPLLFAPSVIVDASSCVLLLILDFFLRSSSSFFILTSCPTQRSPPYSTSSNTSHLTFSQPPSIKSNSFPLIRFLFLPPEGISSGRSDSPSLQRVSGLAKVSRIAGFLLEVETKE